MKKLSLLVGGVVLSTVAMAQKPAAADAPISIEGQLGYNASTFTFNAPSVRARYFVADNIAVRLSLGINNASTTDNYYENEQDNSGAAGTYETSNNSWNLGLGAEYHFTGTDKLSPYVGLDILLGGGKVSSEGASSDGTGYVADYSETAEAKTSKIGVNLVAGTDYYFAENFYIGFELGWGFSSTTWKEGTSETTFGGTTVKNVTNEAKKGWLQNNAISMFRLGWRF